MAESQERTAEEREQARLERERRRGAERGGASDGGPDGTLEELELGGEEDGDAGPDRMLGEPKLVGEEDGDAGPPSGTRWVRGTRPGRPVPPARPARPARPRRRAGAAQNGEAGRPAHPRRGRIVALIALVLAAAIVWFCIELFQPFHGAGQGSVTVVIPRHSSAGSVGSLLERDGVISSGFFFELRATLEGERGSLRPGTYHLKRDMSYSNVLTILTTAPPAAKVTPLTIIEGRTRRQLNALLRGQGVSGSYLNSTRRSPLLNPRSFGAPTRTDSLEGFLFPDTYQLRQPVSIAALVADQLTTFKQRFATVNLSYARSQHLTPYDVLIVASMIEGETPTAHDRPLIASVIYNRLRAGIPLQMDSTVRYAVNNYSSPITQAQLGSTSPWNTYTHAGLPPTPIGNPGLVAIQAAAAPARTNYLFFVAKPCGNGASLFASTYAQFQADQRSYDSARARRGGRSPVTC